MPGSIVGISVPKYIVLVGNVIYAQVKYGKPFTKTMQVGNSERKIVKSRGLVA